MLLLHLSDLHFGSKNRFAGDAPAELSKAFFHALDAARQQVHADSEISIVVITGDIAESGLPSEFRYANEFFNSLADQLNLPPSRFVILPGNHDISWNDCQIVRAGLRGEKFPFSEFDSRLNTAKLGNYRGFLTSFYGGAVTEDIFGGLADVLPLGTDGWLRDFPDLNLSVAALNTSERENDQIKGGFLSAKQAQSIMTLWGQPELRDRFKVLALHHNPISTTKENVRWTVDWLREQERKAGTALPMSTDVFEHYIADLAGFDGKEHLSKIVKDTSVHLVLHGHHHDQGDPMLWPWATDGSAPVLSVGSFGLSEEQLPGDAPLSCQLVSIDIPSSGRNKPRLRATPLVYDGRFRLQGKILAGAFRIEAHSRGAYDQPLPLPAGWRTSQVGTAHTPKPQVRLRQAVPRPPRLYTEPAYIGSHQFVGRQWQLESLNEWASPSESHSVLLFEAIGGAGKSILTWEWTTKHATAVRKDWAGCVWYSFYEKGATMVDFCRRTLGYMMCRSPERLRNKNTAELTAQLSQQLRERPWLLVLDGLERVLVAYHRYDAAQVPDDEAGKTDQIGRRDPCAAINPEDDDLLRTLAGASPSKILLTSRLIPRALLNRSNQPIPGVLHERLPGLRPADAETLIRACGVTGTSSELQKYLKINCDCHPLVIGVLAGLICDYLPNRGNFDAWVRDPQGGGQLTLADLDLVQKRNHILSAALAALPEKSRQLMSILALMSEPVDYPTLCALNPYLPPFPERVEVPKDPRSEATWDSRSSAWKKKALKKYEDAAERWQAYDEAVKQREALSTTALTELGEIVRDLERRGLLQYDQGTRRHDLHPVVRGISAGGLRQEERVQLGRRMVDHFSRQTENPYDLAEKLEDFGNARQIVNALFHMGDLDRALNFIVASSFLSAMAFRFEAHNEVLAVIRPFFIGGWSEMPPSLQKNDRGVVRKAAVALRRLGQFDDAFTVSETAIRWSLQKRPEANPYGQVLDLARTAGDQHRFALEDRLIGFASDLAPFHQGPNPDFALGLTKYRQLSRLGKFSQADTHWTALERADAPHEKALAFHHRALSLHLRGKLTEDDLRRAVDLNRSTGSALGCRDLCALRGWWLCEAREWPAARDTLNEAVSLAHKAGKTDRRSELRLALVRHLLGEAVELHEIVDQFSSSSDPSLFLLLAKLWKAADQPTQAVLHALAAYKWAWADGAPYAHWYECEQSRSFLTELGATVPALPCFSPDQSAALAWEAELVAAIKMFKERGAVRAKGETKYANNAR